MTETLPEHGIARTVGRAADPWTIERYRAAQNAISRWVALEATVESLIVAATNAVEDPRKIVLARLSDVVEEARIAISAPEPDTAWLRSIRARLADQNHTPEAQGSADGGGDEEATWLMPLMDAFETACDAYAQRTRHVDAAADAAEETARVNSINDARFALRNAVRAALRRATPRDVRIVEEHLRRLSEKATPGPWTVVAGDDYFVFSNAVPEIYPHHFRGDDSGRHVAWIGNRAKDFGRADADFIAALANWFRDRPSTEHGEG